MNEIQRLIAQAVKESNLEEVKHAIQLLREASEPLESASPCGGRSSEIERIPCLDLNFLVDENSHQRLIHCAIFPGNIEVVQFLLGLQLIDLNALTQSGRTPLMIAVEAGCLDSAQALLEAGADPNIFGSTDDPKKGSTLSIILSFSIIARYNTFIQNRFFVSKPFTPQEPEPVLTDSDYLGIAQKIFLDEGDPRWNAHGKGAMQFPTVTLSALHLATMLGNLPMMELLHRYGADLNAIKIQCKNHHFPRKNEQKNVSSRETPLDIAIRLNNQAALDFLTKHGAVGSQSFEDQKAVVFTAYLEQLDGFQIQTPLLQLSEILNAISDRYDPMMVIANMAREALDNSRYASLFRPSDASNYITGILICFYEAILQKYNMTMPLDLPDEMTRSNFSALFSFFMNPLDNVSTRLRRSTSLSRAFQDSPGKTQGFNADQQQYSFDVTVEEYILYAAEFEKILKNDSWLSLITDKILSIRDLVKNRFRLLLYLNKHGEIAFREKLIIFEQVSWAEGYCIEALFSDLGLKALRAGFRFNPDIFDERKMKFPSCQLYDELIRYDLNQSAAAETSEECSAPSPNF